MAEHTQSTDRYGLPLSTRSRPAVDHYVTGVDRLLAAEAGAASALHQALDADEGLALAHAVLGLIRQTQGDAAGAQQCIARARATARGVTRREQQHIEVLATWVGGEADQARALALTHLDEYPRDALVLSLHEFLLARSGRPDRHEAAFALLARLAPAYGDDWYFLGLYAFVQHECDRFEVSRRLAERSLALYPRSGPAAHSLAHVFYETDDHVGGSAFLEAWTEGYDPTAPMYGHFAWHLALHALASGHYARGLELYDRAIRPGMTQSRTGMYDAASLLWRYQLYGCAAGPLPWAEVSALAARAAARPGEAFVDANAALALAAGGDEAALGRLIDGWRARAAQGHPTAGAVVLPLLYGVAALARGDYREAVRRLEPVADQVVRLRGSHAQREVFADTLLEAYLRAGEYAKAEAALRRRLARRPSARDAFWLGRALLGQGQVAEARASLEDARTRWAGAEPQGAEQSALRDALRWVERDETQGEAAGPSRVPEPR